MSYQHSSQYTPLLIKELLLVLSDFAKLLQNKEDLTALVENTFSLTETKKKELSEAINTLSGAKELKEEIKKREADAAAMLNHANDRLEEAGNAARKNDTLSNVLNAKHNELKRREEEVSKREAFASKKEADQNAREERLNAIRVDIDKRKAEVSARENELKQRIDRLKNEASTF